MQIMQTRSLVCLSPTRNYRPLADWPVSEMSLWPWADAALLGHADHGVPDVPPPVKNFIPREIYASGGGLLVAPINAPHLFYEQHI